MQKHLDDDGDLNVVVNDSGQALFACAKCHKMWMGVFEPQNVRRGARGSRRSLGGDAIPQGTFRAPVADFLHSAQEQYPDAF